MSHPLPEERDHSRKPDSETPGSNVSFSQLGFYPKTEIRMRHPLPEDRDLISRNQDSKLPASNLIDVFSPSAEDRGLLIFRAWD